MWPATAGERDNAEQCSADTGVQQSAGDQRPGGYEQVSLTCRRCGRLSLRAVSLSQTAGQFLFSSFFYVVNCSIPSGLFREIYVQCPLSTCFLNNSFRALYY